VKYDELVLGIVEKYDRNLKDIVFILEKITWHMDLLTMEGTLGRRW